MNSGEAHLWCHSPETQTDPPLFTHTARYAHKQISSAVSGRAVSLRKRERGGGGRERHVSERERS